MALIGEIRKNSWLLIFLIGLGLASFILMDMFSGNKSVFGSQGTSMGSVAGTSVDWNEFARAENALYRNSGGDVLARRNSLWNYFVEKAIVEKEAKTLGLGVSKDELMDLQFGNNLSPVIQQRFADPNRPGSVLRENLNGFKQQIEAGTLDESLKPFWAHQEKEIIKDRLQTKLSNVVSKSMFTPTWMAEMASVDQNQRATFSYVQVPFDEIGDGEVSLTDADYSNYLKSNAATYEQDEETRIMKYVVFDVMPTGADSAAIRKEIADLIPEFETRKDDSVFVENNYGSIDEAYFKKEQLSPAIADEVFGMAPGSVKGPYIDGNTYKAVKVLDQITVPDSVGCRHILRRATNQTDFFAAKKTIDSLKLLVDSGTFTFEELAKKHSEDASNAANGGDLGNAWMGQMVKPFNDVIFYKGKTGETHVVATQFGVHLVKVGTKQYITNDKGVKLAYLNQPIIPSEDTQKDMYNNVLEFVGQNRTMEQLEASVAANPNISLQTSAPVKKNDFIVGALGSGNSAREMIKNSFEINTGKVSPEIYIFQDPVTAYDNKYVVSGLSAVQGKGMPSVANIKSTIQPFVLNQKKGEMLKSKITSNNLSQVAGNYNAKVDTARNVSFTGVIPGLGNEPKVLSTALSMNVNDVSKPIIGNNGVYLLQVVDKPSVSATTNIPQVRKNTSATIQRQVQSRLLQAMKKNVEIQDNRSTFY